MQQAVRVRRNKNETKHTKPRRTQNIPPKPQQPGDPDDLETAGHETRHTRYTPSSAAFVDAEFVEIGHKAALAISDDVEKGRQTVHSRPAIRQTTCSS